MNLRVTLPKCEIEIEGEKATELFEQFSRVVEVFSEESCGVCDSPDIVPVTRKSPDTKFTFYEWHCKKCRARLALGQQEGGVLFPKRRLKSDGTPCKPGEGGEYRNRGWAKYEGPRHEDDTDTDTNEAPPASTSARTPAKAPPPTHSQPTRRAGK